MGQRIEKRRKDLFAIAVVVRIGRDCLRSSGLRLELGLGLGTQRYLVLWNHCAGAAFGRVAGLVAASF